VAIFLAIDVTQCFIEQTMMLGVEDGASVVIFGLMAMAFLWAPNCNLKAFFCWRLHVPRFFDILISVFCLGMVFLQFLIMQFEVKLLVHGVGSATLHLMGAAIGFAIGLAMLKFNQVEAERCDIFSIIRGKTPEDDDVGFIGRSSDLAKQLTEEQALGDDENDRRRNEFAEVVARKNGPLAWTAYQRFLSDDSEWRSDAIDLLKLIGLLTNQQSWDNAIAAMVDYLRSFEQRSGAVRIQLASVLLDHSGRPTQALHVLAKINRQDLSSDHLARYQKLVSAGRRREGEDALFVVEDW